MASDINDPGVFQDIVSEIVEKVDDFEKSHSNFFDEYNEIASHFRMKVKSSPNKISKGLAHPQVAEITRATETLATIFYKILTAYDPNFMAIPGRRDVSRDDLDSIVAVRVFQDRMIGFKRKVMKYLRSWSLFGGGFWDEPWVRSPHAGQAWQATDFIPKSYLEIAFDKRANDPNDGEFVSSFDYVTKFKLKWIMDNDEFNVWNKEGIEATLSEIEGAREGINDKMRQRLHKAGYKTQDYKNVIEIITYHGYLNKLGDYKDYTVVVSNRRHFLKGHVNVMPHGERRIKYAGLIDFELEPLGYGVGNLALPMCKDINTNRARMSDIITFSLFSIWKASRLAGVDMSTMQVKPWNIIEMDDITGFEPIRPDLAGVMHGMNLETRMKEDVRAVTAATSNLQATITGATAREAILAQNEAIRRVSAYGELIAENLIRQRQIRAHKNNMKFLDKELWLSVGGSAPRAVHPSQIDKDVDFLPKIISDKDFAPNRNRRLIELLTIVTSTKAQLPPQMQYLVSTIIDEIVRGLEITPPKPQEMNEEGAKMRMMKLMQQISGGGGQPVEMPPGEREPQESLGETNVVSPSSLMGVME